MQLRQACLWMEAILCLGPTALACAIGLLIGTHYVVTTLFFGSWVPGWAWAIPLYAVGSAIGLAAGAIMIATHMGTTASPRVLQIARIGLPMGVAAVLLIPEGALPQLRFTDDFDTSREIFRSIAPALCLIHFAFLGRKQLYLGASTQGNPR